MTASFAAPLRERCPLLRCARHSSLDVASFDLFNNAKSAEH